MSNQLEIKDAEEEKSGTELITLDIPELVKLEPLMADKIRDSFSPMLTDLKSHEQEYNAIMKESLKGVTDELERRAKILRIAISKPRIASDKEKTAQKSAVLLLGRAIDGANNHIKLMAVEMETNLKSIENDRAIQEKKRLEALQIERVKLISDYIEYASERDLASMDDDVWDAFFAQKKKAHEDRIAAEQKAEEERIAREKAEAEERERIRIENERLKKEAEKRESQRKKEEEARAKAEAERLKKEEAERKRREAEEAKRKAEYEAKLKNEREAREAAEKSEREKREAAERALREKEEAEQKAKEEEQARIQAELNKGDEAKLEDLIADLEGLKTKYSFRSQKNIKMYNDVGLLLDKVLGHIKQSF